MMMCGGEWEWEKNEFKVKQENIRQGKLCSLGKVRAGEEKREIKIMEIL